MAEGSHGWKPNWADLPAAAIISPRSGRLRSKFLAFINSCCISQELSLAIIHAIVRISPISASRLYITAWRAAVLASARPYHHPISRNDIMPTPSHPMKN